jgi:23S rRNA U2552 (ribose-2'-O)-methylase RlmE/FtsJ
MIHKWVHYLPIYARHLRPYRGRNVTVLEIGVSHGGSLQMWRHYLGRRATIVGIDIEPRAAPLAESRINIHVGDQSDPQFLAELVRLYGSFDVVIDDGSHRPRDQIASLEHLWPHVSDDGVYIVEDLHSNYWPEFGGGKGKEGTLVAWAHSRIDDMHAYHSRETAFKVNDWTRTLNALHVYDSVLVFEKSRRNPPVSRKTGRPSFDDIYGIPIDEALDDYHRDQLAYRYVTLARARRAARRPRATVRRVAASLRRR